MKFEWRSGLPFITIIIEVKDKQKTLDKVLVDTGAASSLFNIDSVFEQGVDFEPEDTICKMVGIGGTEYVIQREIESVSIDNAKVDKPKVQFGEMDYGFPIDGIIGADILKRVNAIIDFELDSISANS